MAELYKEQIIRLLGQVPFEIDLDLQVSGRPPSEASSEFLTNREQGVWAENVVCNAINQYMQDYIAIHYGRAEVLAPGDEGFEEFYRKYQDELNCLGKKPDILIFRRSEIDCDNLDLDDDATISKAIAGIEVRSSSFLVERYNQYMENRVANAISECERLRSEILQEPLAGILNQKSPELYRLLASATRDTFRELDFHWRSWSSSSELRQLSELLRQLKNQIKILHKRSYLSITPKVEDLVLVNRWIQQFNVRHYYLQVFFDKAYIIGFKDILKICSNPAQEGVVFSIERDVKNQRKTTIKINVEVGQEILGRIVMPEHRSMMRELTRGRLLFYVTFEGGQGYLDQQVFMREIINDV